ncbi:hypothetical protein [Rhizobium sp. BK176]|uniref:hypothetical protein n=1 Tax=Rhizobium sp. BK176 TaxID=2587071 RepID=UPI00216750FC|nr:hypothetical protein [Rhizobium sp. BK176]MCS4088814.1 hypothetical protein [Rhizobium sp. BK176]
MSEIKSFTSTKRIVETTKLSCKAVSDRLSVYTTWLTTEVVDSGAAASTKIIKQGLVENAKVAKLRNGKTVVPDFEPIRSDKDRRFQMVLITPEGREYIRVHGNPLAYSKVWEHMEREKMLLFPKGDVAWVEVLDEGNLRNVHFVSTYDHSIVDIDGRLAPVARTFEFTNGEYDLDKASEVLAANPEMEIVLDRRGSRIHQIPSYNVSEGRTLEMKVKWMPGPESWAKLVGQMATLRSPNGSPVLRLAEHELMYGYDPLGLDAAGCRRPSRYEEE